MTSIVEYYQDKCVLITGATGFLGKVLLEKLLRSCRGIEKIYVLTRARADLTPQQRIEKVIQSQLFQSVREIPQLVDKVVAIKGDISEPELGISEEDKFLITENVHIVFHSAATVRFDEELRTSLLLNVNGTEQIIKLCKEVKNLEVLVHVSSTYANCDRTVVDEKIYPPSVEPEKLAKSIEWMSDDMVKALTPHVIDKRPNTYTFTKSLAEHVLSQQADDLPVTIFRPSIIGASLKEPIRGWVDNFNGPSGLFVMAGKGMLRFMSGEINAIADIIPVDTAANMMICIAWEMGTKRWKGSGIPVYNCCTGTINPITWGKLVEVTRPSFAIYPYDDVFRRPNFNFESRKLWHFYYTYISHRIPAIIADTMCLFIGKKPRMNRLYSKIEKATSIMKDFTTREWQFTTTNNLRLLETLSPEDKQTFGFDVRDLNWDSYFKDYVIGIKLFLLKEDMKNLDLAHKRVRKLRNIRWSMYAMMFVLLSWLLIKKVPAIRMASLKLLMRARVIFSALEPFMLVN